ncbi:recombinase family protein [Atlantibacter hermannii]|uniref:recombinase family protein n=1 Tax=Atlantibacter hermannii TaxID=565 RepID=UPI0028AB257E|nr:recombinase family protein [Atlantibacter hermannii]
MHSTRLYLRASTDEQDAKRARETMLQFATDHGLNIVAEYVDNASGASLQRPELDRLLKDAQPSEILLVESTDRLTRLSAAEWELLKGLLQDRGLRLVIADVPTSYMNIQTGNAVTDGIMKAINTMLIEILATMAREDYEKRRNRQLQGIAKAKAEGKFRGRPADTKLRDKITSYLDKDKYTMTEIAKLCDCSIGMVAKVKGLINNA